MFVIALILPYLKALLPKPGKVPVPLAVFSLSDADVTQWILDVEPTLKVFGGSTGSLTSIESIEMEFEYFVTSKSTERKDVLRYDVLSNVRAEIRDLITKNGLLVGQTMVSDESFSFVLATGHSRYRIYVRTVPYSSAESERWETATDGDPLLCMKLIFIGYNQATPTNGGN